MVYDVGATPTSLLRRGDHTRPGARSARVSFMLCSADADSRIAVRGEQRSSLGRWLNDAAGASSCVRVNRIWQHLFGRGWSNPPTTLADRFETTRRLLEWLAAEYLRGDRQLSRS